MTKPTIVTRLEKGSALTWEEGDANFENLRDAALPTGGTNGQFLIKTGNEDYDVGFGSLNIQVDTSPNLGGSLNVGLNRIFSQASGNIDWGNNENPTTFRIDNSSGAFRITSLMTPAGGGIGFKGYDFENPSEVIEIDINGVVRINNLQYPATDGTAGQVLTTDGSGTLSWTTVEGGGSSGIAALVDDPEPVLGGSLDTGFYRISSSFGGNIFWGNDQNPVTFGIDNSAGAFRLGSIYYAEDGIGFKVYDFGNPAANLEIDINGAVRLNNILYPSTDGSAGQVLTTDGAGELSWTTVSSGGAEINDNIISATETWSSSKISTEIAAVNVGIEFEQVQPFAQGQILAYSNVLNKFANILPILTNFSDVDLTNPSAGEFLAYDGTNWVNQALVAGIEELEDDTAPTLGGDLNLNDFKIASGANGTVSLSGIVNLEPTLEFEPGAFGSVITADATAAAIGFGIDILGNQNNTVVVLTKEAMLVEIDQEYVFELDTTGLQVNGTINGYNFPEDGTAGQVLTTDGAGNLSWTAVGGGGSGGITALEDDVNPTLGGDLNLNDFLITSNENLTLSISESGAFSNFQIEKYLDGSSNTVVETTLESGDQSIIMNSGAYDSQSQQVEPGSIEISGTLTLNGQLFPGQDGTAGQVLTTDGAGELYWETPTGGGAGAESLDELSDVTITQATGGDFLYFNGTSWVNQNFTLGIEELEDDVNPTLGGNLNLNGFDIVGETIAFQSFPQTDSQIEFILSRGDDGAGGLFGFWELSEGGGQSITFQGATFNNGNIVDDGRIDIDGNTRINGILHPNTDGTAGQVLTTDGAGELVFENRVASADVFTIVKITQQDYDNLVTPDANTLYLIEDV